jgi:hypothetical protein
MQDARKKRTSDSSEQIAGGEEKRKDNAEAQRTQRFDEKRTQERWQQSQRYIEGLREGEKRKMFVIGLKA